MGMYFSRDAGGGLFVVKIKTKLSIDYLKRKGATILYKYVVFSHHSEAENPYEYLYGAPHGGGLTNRALKLPYSIDSPGGQYNTSEEVGHASSLVIQCHVIVVNIVKIRADFGTFWNLIN